MARDFLPEQAEKDKLAAKDHGAARGYFGKGGENLGGVINESDTREVSTGQKVSYIVMAYVVMAYIVMASIVMSI